MKTPDILPALRQRLADADNLAAVARRAGLSRSTAERIRDGETGLTLDTLTRLSLALDGETTPPKLRRSDSAQAA